MRYYCQNYKMETGVVEKQKTYFKAKNLSPKQNL